MLVAKVNGHYFYPRPPRGGRRASLLLVFTFIQFLPTPSARRATAREMLERKVRGISTHALREEGDRQNWHRSRSRPGFLPTPSARRATRPAAASTSLMLFLPTPSARRATCRTRGTLAGQRYFYPRPPRGGRLASQSVVNRTREFLPTPSARRATNGAPCCRVRPCNFYPRPPRGGRRDGGGGRHTQLHISTHALREEGDSAGRRWDRSACIHFYPRPPRGGRLLHAGIVAHLISFLPTPSARRATLSGASP